MVEGGDISEVVQESPFLCRSTTADRGRMRRQEVTDKREAHWQHDEWRWDQIKKHMTNFRTVVRRM